MSTITRETRFDLLRNESVSLSNAKNYTLTCYRGELWITQEGDKRDIKAEGLMATKRGEWQWRIATRTGRGG